MVTDGEERCPGCYERATFFFCAFQDFHRRVLNRFTLAQNTSDSCVRVCVS